MLRPALLRPEAIGNFPELPIVSIWMIRMVQVFGLHLRMVVIWIKLGFARQSMANILHRMYREHL